MADAIHRDSFSAWNALRLTGGVDVDDRDNDLIEKLKERLDPSAPDLERALAGATIEDFLSALFSSIQPFVSMFKDILTFFERAGARQGQRQWRVSVGDEFLDLRHFEEFLEHWNTIDVDFEVPALDQRHAFILNDIRVEVGGYGYLVDGMERGKPSTTGLSDVDDWLAEYDSGRYGPFPSSIMPQNFPVGLSDAAHVVLAAVTILRQHSLTREEMLREHRARHFKSVDDDALHPWTIAQSETDFWLRSHVGYLANIRRRPQEEVHELAATAVAKFAPFPRRRVPGKIAFKDMERLLSLPVWKQRYETYGVWIATRIVDSLDDHKVVVNSDNGELKFGFGEARIADVETVNPKLSLFAERRVALANPLGKSRTEGAQPDFGIWTCGTHFPECLLVVEVKHYKKRSRRNFRDALVDYSKAHPRARVALVNYGPVGEDFGDMPVMIRERCQMIGPLTPESYQALANFRELVRAVVGNPIEVAQSNGSAAAGHIVALDVSASMKSILGSEALRKILAQTLGMDALALIDQDVRAIVSGRELEQWLRSTSLAAPIEELLSQYEQIVVVTDDSGLKSLIGLSHVRLESPLSEARDAIFVRVTR